MTTTTTAEPTTGTAAVRVATTLRRLYLVRFGFAAVWAALVFLIGSQITPVLAVLLVAYPLFDVAAAVVDARSARAARPGNGSGATGLYLTMAVSTLAAVGVGIALVSGVPAVLRVWGIWAAVAGLTQLVVAVRRRGLGGQWAMIASGAISVAAGVSFFLQSFDPGAALGSIAGYALAGGIFFLISALRLGRTASHG